MLRKAKLVVRRAVRFCPLPAPRLRILRKKKESKEMWMPVKLHPKPPLKTNPQPERWMKVMYRPKVQPMRKFHENLSLTKYATKKLQCRRRLCKQNNARKILFR